MLRETQTDRHTKSELCSIRLLQKGVVEAGVVVTFMTYNVCNPNIFKPEAMEQLVTGVQIIKFKSRRPKLEEKQSGNITDDITDFL